jgi:hypothetical protein
LVDPTGHKWWKKLLGFVGTIVGTAVGAAFGNPFLGIAINSAFNAGASGGNFAQNLGIGLASGLVGLGIGAGISSLDFLGKTTGFFTATLSSAGAGAVGAALGGGNIGLAALSGAVGGGVGYIGGLKSIGLGNILGGMASAGVAGREIWEGAVHGMSANIGLVMSGMLMPSQTGQELAGNLEAGDVLFEKGSIFKLFKSNPIKATFAALIGDPGPFSHTGIAAGPDTIVDSYPGTDNYPSGPRARSMRDHPASGAQWVRVRTGNAALGRAASALATNLQDQGVVFYGEGANGVFCSQFCGQVYGKAGMSTIKGVGPNTQHFQLRLQGYR